ncbi:thioredoxin family protein [Glaciecola sp. 2405UD65-10]|jgi:thioredoxin-related protein|uniref:thioredoxin family protein n=1 Tax=Glaciecola sp. 2405UD65-10 TaxID=3397244 RepID=UPI003B58D97C
MNKLIKNVIAIAAIVAIVFFTNKGVQSYLGEQALEDLAFEVHEFDAAMELAESEGKLVLADYSAIWCPSCRKLDKEVFANPDVANYIKNNYVFTRVDHDTASGAEFARKYAVVGFPRVLILNAKGDKLSELPLSFESTQYKANLSKAFHAFSSRSY